jgi:hypothetical protein
MKECCKDAFEKPTKWQRWKSRIIYMIVFLALALVTITEYLKQ